MDDSTLDFSALMEGLGGEDFAATLEAVARDEAKPGDDSILIITAPMSIGQMRQLREAYVHCIDHGCADGARVLLGHTAQALLAIHPFLEMLDAEGDAPDSSGRGHLAADEEGDDGCDGGVQGDD